MVGSCNGKKSNISGSYCSVKKNFRNTYGLPEKKIIDNSTPFVSEEIKHFYITNGIK